MTTAAHRSRPLQFGITAGLPGDGAQSPAFAQHGEAVGIDVLTFALPRSFVSSDEFPDDLESNLYERDIDRDNRR